VIPDQIEREIVIDAPPEVVWKVITEPEHIASWFSDEAEADVRPGGEGRLTWVEGGRVKSVEGGFVARLRVERVEPTHLFAFRWDYPEGEEPRPGNSQLVEFRLAPEGDGTRLTLTESGITALERTEDEKKAFVESHGNGWDFHLGTLAAYAAQLAGTPTG